MKHHSAEKIPSGHLGRILLPVIRILQIIPDTLGFLVREEGWSEGKEDRGLGKNMARVQGLLSLLAKCFL
jgi:hypothetical protein